MKKLEELLQAMNLQKSSLQEQKAGLRRHFFALREEHHLRSKPEDWGARQFLRSLELLNIKNQEKKHSNFLFACYFPIHHELNLSQFAKEHWLFPRIDKNKELLWFEYGDGETNYNVNKYGIKEKKECECFAYTHNHPPLICFLPGLAADTEGNRLGYGGGYYDKFLSKFNDRVSTVFCLPSKNFLLDKLPAEQSDQKVDLIVF